MTTPTGSADADYSWTTEVATPGIPRMSAEDWLEETWDHGPRFLRWFLHVGWRAGLGLRLKPGTATGQVSGWPVTHSDPRRVVVAADARTMQAGNTLTVNTDSIVWTTTITYVHPIGRLLWLPARPIHEWLIPRSLARAIRQREVITS